MIKVRMRSDKVFTDVMDTDAGERVKGLAAVNVRHDQGSVPVIDLEIVSSEVGSFDVEGYAQFSVMSTATGEMKAVKRIEFSDGEVIDY